MDPCQLELGTATPDAGGVGFAEMPAEATLVPGAQGGFHIWVSYRVKGAAPGTTLTASHTVRRVSDMKLLSRGSRKLDIETLGQDGWWQSDTATPAFLCPAPLGVSIIDEHAIFEVILTSSDGTEMGRQLVETQLKCPTDGQADFCMRICTG
jgi:hypothetical protein